MIVGIGTDIIEIDRVVRACEKPAFLKKCFTEQERQLVRQRPGRAAVNFAAKEAVSKVLGTGFREYTPKEIEVLRDELGAPYVILHGNALKRAEEMGIKKISLSLSDSKQYAVAFAVGEGDTYAGCCK